MGYMPLRELGVCLMESKTGTFPSVLGQVIITDVLTRLRHLEEVDILRHLSRDHNQSSHVIRFVDAWEQNRQLFIQTELCLGSLAFFLEEYGRVVERLDEGRVWKIVAELGDVGRVMLLNNSQKQTLT